MRKDIINLLTLICLISLTSCSKTEDPFYNVKFGEISKKRFVEEMISKNVLVPIKNDSTSLRYYLKTNGKSFPIMVYINEQWLDGYDFGKLRKFEFNIGTDTEKYGSICHGCGPISKKDVDQIYEYYIDQYGKPDSLIEKNKYRYSDDFKKMFEEIAAKKPSILDTTIPKSRRAIWLKKNFKLTINLPHPTRNKSKGGEFYYDMPDSNEGYVHIGYEMLNYQEEFKRITDSIRASLKPNNILNFNLGEPLWSDLNSNTSKLEIKLGEIRRLDIEEPKRIKGFKYDIIFLNSFGEELYKFDDNTFDINNNDSYLESRPRKGIVGQVMFIDANMTFYVNYNKFSEKGKKLQSIRDKMKYNKVIIKADIKKILFEDNTVLQ